MLLQLNGEKRKMGVHMGTEGRALYLKRERYVADDPNEIAWLRMNRFKCLARQVLVRRTFLLLSPTRLRFRGRTCCSPLHKT